MVGGHRAGRAGARGQEGELTLLPFSSSDAHPLFHSISLPCQPLPDPHGILSDACLPAYVAARAFDLQREQTELISTHLARAHRLAASAPQCPRWLHSLTQTSPPTVTHADPSSDHPASWTSSQRRWCLALDGQRRQRGRGRDLVRGRGHLGPRGQLVSRPRPAQLSHRHVLTSLFLSSSAHPTARPSTCATTAAVRTASTRSPTSGCSIPTL